MQKICVIKISLVVYAVLENIDEDKHTNFLSLLHPAVPL